MKSKILEIKQISKHFGGVKALSQCTFSIEPNKITALIGPNGSGKSTLFDIISQLTNEDHGEIKLDHATISNLKPHDIAKEGVSRTFQDPILFKNLTINDHFEIAMQNEDEKLIKSFFSKKADNSHKIHEIMN